MLLNGLVRESIEYSEELERTKYSILINTKIFYKGELKRSQVKDKYFSRLFVDNVRFIYNSTTHRNMKYFGYTLMLLPYSSYNHNLLCKNPTEGNFRDIVPLKLNELSNMLGLSERGFNLLMGKLYDIKNKDNTPIAVVINVSRQGKKAKRRRVFLSHSLTYMGDMDYENTKVVKEIFSNYNLHKKEGACLIYE
jgi:hypothetical protein